MNCFQILHVEIVLESVSLLSRRERFEQLFSNDDNDSIGLNIEDDHKLADQSNTVEKKLKDLNGKKGFIVI